MSRPAPNEEWRPFFDGRFEVSDHGRVRRISTGHYLTPQTSRAGYIQYCFWFDRSNHCREIHRVVARLFLGEVPGWERLDVNHKDGNKLNPRVENLEWVTRSENQKHSYRTGLHSGTRGEVSGRARFTNEQIIDLRAAFAAGRTRRQLAEQYGVGKPTIDKIVKRKRWTHI